MTDRPWQIDRGDDCIIATAIHDGHDLRPDIAAHMKLSNEGRLLEEDPHTGVWTSCAASSIVVSRSRFEVDLNRPRDKAIYRQPEDAWGLDLWSTPLPDEAVAASLQIYDDFYADLAAMCDDVLTRHERFVLFDIHSYNHRRAGATATVDDPAANPEINLGTESINRHHWGDIIECYADALGHVPFDDAPLDIRENVRFKGGALPRWINARYGERGCAIAVEMKKIFMDEWTGVPDDTAIINLDEILTSAADAVRRALEPSDDQDNPVSE